MSQKGRAGKNLIQVGRDYIRTIEVNILNGNCIPIITQPCKWVKSLFQKEKIINELKRQLESQDRRIEEILIRHRLEIREKSLEIKKLQEDLHQQTKDYFYALEQMNSARDIVANIHQNIVETDFDQQTILDLKHLIQSFNKLDEQNKQAESCINASFWVGNCLRKWAQEAKDIAVIEHPNLISEVELFYQDIYKYLEWLHNSLFYAMPLNSQLDELNQSRTLRSPFPYRTAFKHIKLNGEISSLSPKEAYYLRAMLEHLIERL